MPLQALGPRLCVNGDGRSRVPGGTARYCAVCGPQMRRQQRRVWKRANKKLWYDEDRALGLCVQCGKKTEINPATGKPFAQCRDHRLAAAAYYKVHYGAQRATRRQQCEEIT